MAASLLTAETVVLSNVPLVSDINAMLKLLNNHGAIHNWEDDQNLSISASDITNFVAPYDIVRTMRASIWALGPLLARFGYAEVSMPGGCAIGARLVDQHILALEHMGAEISIHNGYIIAKSSEKNGKRRLRGASYTFSKVSVGATINSIMAATLADGITILNNCACEPEIVDLCNMLQKMGAKIDGVGSNNISIIGVDTLNGCAHQLISDRIEAGTYIMAVGMTGGSITLENCDYRLIENFVTHMKDVGISIIDSRDKIQVSSSGNIKSMDISTGVYPGFATDLQAQYMAMMTVASGTSMISEHIFENRFMHIPELCRMGANISVDGHTAIVRSVDTLHPATVMASDLRASVSLVMAALVANGTTKIRRIYHLERGYQDLCGKLNACGADITRVLEA
jgi:UDP-N-acetylglucosamine 1-carboxyvinyltransferase